MTNSPYFWWGFLAFFIFTNLWSLYKGYKTKRFVYELKGIVNGLRPLITMIWIIYFMLGAAYLVTPINNWIESAALQSSSLVGQTIINTMPLVFIITVWVIIFKLIGTMSKPFIKYNDKEKEYQREASDKFKAKLPRILRRFVKAS